jgi:hypothetical protein
MGIGEENVNRDLKTQKRISKWLTVENEVDQRATSGLAKLGLK